MGRTKKYQFHKRKYSVEELRQILNSNDSIDDITGVKLSNRFEPLSSTDTDTEPDELMETANEINKKRARENTSEEKIRKKTALSPKASTSKNDPKELDRKMPTVIIKSEIPHHVLKTIKSNIKKDLSIQYISKNHLRVNTYTTTDNEYLLKYLRDNKYNFFTHGDKKETNKKIVLRGIDPNIDIEDIKEDLQNKEINVSKIIQMSKKVEGNISYKLPIYIVVLTPQQDIGKVTEVRHILGYIVKWEKLHASERLLQCYNCQNFGHAARYCNLKYRCVKCKEDHEPGKCSKSKEEKPQCVNCGNLHPANYRNCPFLIELRNKIRNKPLNQNKAVDAPPPPKQTKSYSELLKETATNNQNNEERQENSSSTNSDIFNTMKQIQDLLSKFDLSKIISNIQKFLPKIMNAKNITDFIIIGMEFFNATFK